MDIPAPDLPTDHPRRLAGCEFALEPAFDLLVAAAVEKGWTVDEVTSALIGLAAKQAVRLIATKGTEAEMDAAKRMILALNSRP
jgi:hypothetical protein